MQGVFADSSYWIALLNPRDVLHEKALALSREKEYHPIFTSEMVFTEFLNSFCGVGQHMRQVAATAVASLRGAPQVIVVPQTSLLFQKAFKRYAEMVDKNWSLTDCASFVITDEERLTAALTHDRHFAQAGFQTLLR
jgi:uncharacterized protein